EENETNCLGVLPFSVRKFTATKSDPRLKVPQMGWNRIRTFRGPLFEGIPEDSFMYFANSFRVPESASAAAHSEYGGEYVCAVSKGNFHGVQFHPEKSAALGMRVLENFLSLASSRNV
ncbi:UNVERIFIED_CONTAM: hypothetical protein GTU68_044942, partial [Idotea baltica]|nr:hypothetical protein [Idotea baltica]